MDNKEIRLPWTETEVGRVTEEKLAELTDSYEVKSFQKHIFSDGQ